MRISDWSSDVCSSDLHCSFDDAILARAIRATFERRKTAIPPRLPFGLTDEFAQDESKARQWVAFLQKNALEAKIGRASCRERECQERVDLGGRRIIKKKNSRCQTN